MKIVSAFIPLLAAAALLSVGSHALKVGEICGSENANCDEGLLCQACGDWDKICSQISPISAQSKAKGLPFNRYAWLTTHNSFARTNQMSDTGSPIVAPANQDDTVTDQLKNGVRGLMLDMYDFRDEIWLCHSISGNCYDFTAFQPAIKVLKEIETFLTANPTEIITIFIEDYVRTPQGLTNLFKDAGLSKYLFPVDKMPRDGADWPLISDMISQNQRLVVFTSKKAKQASEGIAYVWDYVVENQYGDGGMREGSCPSRDESNPMNTTTKSLVLVNYFPDDPDPSSSCVTHSASLVNMLKTCQKLSGNRWANFIAVDFYKRNNGGGAPLAVDMVNGHLVCGCDSIAYCKVNGTFGNCDAPASTSSPIQQGNSHSPSSPEDWIGSKSSKEPPAGSKASSPCKSSIGNWLLHFAALVVTAMSLLPWG